MNPLPTFLSRIADLALLAILIGLGAVLTTAMGFQYLANEIPCPLCLLQRVAMFGICIGIIQNFRIGYDVRNIGISLLWGLFLLLVSVRHVLLNIVARPGHAYPGSAVFGMHMPVWSVVIAFLVLLVLAAVIALLNVEYLRLRPPSAVLLWIGNIVGLYVIVLALINLISVIVQCGIATCHTTGYRLL